MILVDFSQIILATIHADVGRDGELNPDLIRHMCFNTVRHYNKKYRDKYGQMVICCDNSRGGYWRTQQNDAYKYRRKAARKESTFDWETVFTVISEAIDGLDRFFPYPVISIPGCEADDIIGALTEKYHADGPIMIVSGDKDFKQLQRYPTVAQYSPILKKQIYEADAIRYLKEHIIRGDGGDDIPNILTRLSFFKDKMPGERQKSIFEKKLVPWLDQRPEDFCTSNEMLKRFRENEQMIDLTFIPEEVKEKIIQGHKDAATDDQIYLYFMQKDLSRLLTYIADFAPAQKLKPMQAGNLAGLFS